MDAYIDNFNRLGDLADAVFRANTRNAAVLEQYLRDKGAKALKAQGQPVPALDPSDPDEYDRHMTEQHGPPPEYTAGPSAGQRVRQQDAEAQISLPPAARVAGSKGGGMGWLFGSRSKTADVEAGDTRRVDDALPPLPGQRPST